MGDTIEDKKIIQKILRSLPVKYDHIVAAIEESKDLSMLTLTELMDSLQAHEDRMRRFNEQSLENAFQSKINFSNNEDEKKNSHGKKFYKKGRNTNYRGWVRENYKNNESSKSSPYCRLCKKNNHETQNFRFK